MSADVRAEIDAVNAQFVDGAGRGDVEAMGGVYTSDARILPPGQPMVQGRAANELTVYSIDLSTYVGIHLATSWSW